MSSLRILCLLALFALSILFCPFSLGFSHKTPSQTSTPTVNSIEVPEQILRTGINLNIEEISPNTRQLADIIGLTPLLKSIQTNRSASREKGELLSLEDLRASHDLSLGIVDAMQIIQEANLQIDFALAEISAEQNIYTDILSGYENARDRAVFKTNAISFITNGVLWAVCEGLAIPTYRYPRLSVSSGVNGILAGMVPSVASMYALHQLNGKKSTSENDPNMLAKLFGYPTTLDVEYPHWVWTFLNTVPATEIGHKTRKELIIERWVSDKNIAKFTDSNSKEDLDILTASVSHRKGLSISTLRLRQIMLQQLSAEILKMKRMLLELSMVIRGEKHI